MAVAGAEGATGVGAAVVAPGVAPDGAGRSSDGLGTGTELADVLVSIAARRDDPGRGEATVTYDVHGPATVVLASGRDDLAAARQGR